MGIDPQTLQVGQIVVVKELNFGVFITPTSEGETGWTVVERSHDCLVLDDESGGRKQIPLYLISKTAPAPVELRESA